MAQPVTNGDHGSGSKPPPTPSPSPLRFSKFNQSNMRNLVTGGAGFIGSHLVDRLMENEKNEVIVADNDFTGSKDNLKKWMGHPRFELIRHDVTERLLIEHGSFIDSTFHVPGEFTMLELAQTVKELINPAVEIAMVENTPDGPRQRKPDITKATELLRWQPKIKLRDGFPLMEGDFRQRLGVART